MSTKSEYGLAALSGALLVLSFPSPGTPAVGWLALTPLLVVLGMRGSAHPFLLGLTTGGVSFLGTLYWVTFVMTTYGGLQTWTAVLVNAALIAYLALYPAAFALIVRRLVNEAGPAGLLAAPLVWVATELARTYLLTGFPWVLLGYSQARVLPIAQLASVLGVYGVSALVAAVSTGVAFAIVGVQRRAGLPRALTPLAVAVALTAAVAAWGGRRVAAGELAATGEALTVGLVQGNVDQGEKWDAARAGAIFQDYLRLTREAVAGGARLVVWPESSTPFYFEEDGASADGIRALAREARASMLFGSDQIERGSEARYYNAAFMLRPDGTTGGVYRKMHLVPFGEYVPLKRLLFFVAPLVEAVSDFSPGRDPVLLPIGAHQVSTAICYEVVYPDLVRLSVAQGSELLTTITNDAWFGRTSAPHQHFAQASMRAIENGRYLVRSANTGISGIVDPYGRVTAETGLYQRTVVVGQVRLHLGQTLYTRIGDVFAYAASLATLALLVATWRRVQ